MAGFDSPRPGGRTIDKIWTGHVSFMVDGGPPLRNSGVPALHGAVGDERGHRPGANAVVDVDHG